MMERCNAARTVKTKTGVLVSQFIFHNNGEPIVDFRKAWARACCMAGVGKMVCPTCKGSVDANAIAPSAQRL